MNRCGFVTTIGKWTEGLQRSAEERLQAKSLSSACNLRVPLLALRCSALRPSVPSASSRPSSRRLLRRRVKADRARGQIILAIAAIGAEREPGIAQRVQIAARERGIGAVLLPRFRE